MAVSAEFREYVLEQLGRVAPVTARSMFGGAGVYAGGLCFALLANDTLYLKVDDTNQADFEAAGMKAFEPYGDGRTMRYFELPPDVLEDVDRLRPWMERAVAVARNAHRGKRKG